MRKFRFICAIEYAGFKFGEVYDYGVECPEEHTHDTSFYIDRYPEDWKEVFEVEDKQKSPEQYYAGGTNTLSISGTFDGVEFSLSGDFEKCLTILDFISTLEIKK